MVNLDGTDPLLQATCCPLHHTVLTLLAPVCLGRRRRGRRFGACPYPYPYPYARTPNPHSSPGRWPRLARTDGTDPLPQATCCPLHPHTVLTLLAPVCLGRRSADGHEHLQNQDLRICGFPVSAAAAVSAPVVSAAAVVAVARPSPMERVEKVRSNPYPYP